jgi:hypothetical protein
MAKTIKKKRQGFGLDMKTFEGSKGTYIVFKLPNGAFHGAVTASASGTIDRLRLAGYSNAAPVIQIVTYRPFAKVRRRATCVAS